VKILDTVLLISITLLCIFNTYFFYICSQNFMTLHSNAAMLEDRINTMVVPVPSESKDIDCTTALSSQLWEKLQKNFTNTVLQLFVTGEEHNVLQPYKTPKSGGGMGSGFIISSEGEVITNAHVVNGVVCIMAQMSAFGKHQFELELVGLMPEKDFAMCRFKPTDLELIKNKLGSVPFLKLGDSDKITRSQEILALGYPLGQQALKSTTGVISGRETGMIQMSAPINPGSSGGPSINCMGEVIGINTSGVMGAQNVGYIIPINDLKIFLKDLRAGGLVRKPYIGVYQSLATPELLKALGNPPPGGAYVVDVLIDSPLYQKLLPGDMIYEINGTPIDLYGEVCVPWSEDKICTAEYISRLHVGQKVRLVVYRKGKKMNFECTFDRKKLLPVRQVFTEYEPLPYECFGGYVIMPLMLNHLPHLAPLMPMLAKYTEEKYQSKPLLIVTHIFPDSPAHRARMSLTGSILKKVNDKPVATLSDLVAALKNAKEIITIETDDHILVALDKEKVVKAEPCLAKKFGYKVTPCMQQLLGQEK
jgi:serine protease Do